MAYAARCHLSPCIPRVQGHPRLWLRPRGAMLFTSSLIVFTSSLIDWLENDARCVKMAEGGARSTVLNDTLAALLRTSNETLKELKRSNDQTQQSQETILRAVEALGRAPIGSVGTPVRSTTSSRSPAGDRLTPRALTATTTFSRANIASCTLSQIPFY